MKNLNIIEFKLPDKQIIFLKIIKNKKKKFVAKSPYLKIGKIKVDELFFKFPYNEQVSIIFHELWHYKNNLIFELKYLIKKPWLIFYSKPIYHDQEFNADLYAQSMTNKRDALNMLIRLSKMIDMGLLPKSHEKTHPQIKERIKHLSQF